MTTPTTEALIEAAERAIREDCFATASPVYAHTRTLAAHARALDAEVTRLAGALEEARAAEGCADYLAVCQALGIVYQADGMADHEGPIADVLREVARLKAADDSRDTARAAIEAAEERGARWALDAALGEWPEVTAAMNANDYGPHDPPPEARNAVAAVITRTARSRP